MKLTSAYLIIALFALGCVGCGEQKKAHPIENEKLRTDIEPISRRLTKLGKLQAVWWKSTPLASNSFLSPPGNSAFRIYGFCQLEFERAKVVSEKFSWQPVALDWKPQLTLTNLNSALDTWNRSEKFTLEMKPFKIPGELFFERQKGLVYFDLEIE